MKTNIPNNPISKDYKVVLTTFVDKLVNTEQDNLISIFLTGSFARGEANENSDMDIWCIYKKIGPQTLTNAGTIVRDSPIRYDEFEINVQCLTLDELNSRHFSKFISYPIMYLESVLLWGDDVLQKNLENEEVKKTYNELLAEILLSIRHYIAVNEPAEKLTYQKITTWVLNPLMFALRLERYLHTNTYPLTKLDLANAYHTVPKSVQYSMNQEQWNNDIINNKEMTLYALHNEIETLMRTE